MAWIFDITCFGATAKWTDIVGTLFIVGFTLSSAVYKSFINSKDWLTLNKLMEDIQGLETPCLSSGGGVVSINPLLPLVVKSSSNNKRLHFKRRSTVQYDVVSPATYKFKLDENP